MVASIAVYSKLDYGASLRHLGLEVERMAIELAVTVACSMLALEVVLGKDSGILDIVGIVGEVEGGHYGSMAVVGIAVEDIAVGDTAGDTAEDTAEDTAAGIVVPGILVAVAQPAFRQYILLILLCLY